MKRFLSFLAAASMVIGFASCSDNDPEPVPIPDHEKVVEEIFENVPVFVENEAAAPKWVEGNSVVKLEPFKAVYPWKVSVNDSASPLAKALGTRAEEAGFRLSYSENPSATTFTEEGGGADGRTIQLYLIAPPVPAEGNVSANVELTMTTDSKSNTTESFTLYKAWTGDKDYSFSVYAGVPAAAGSDQLFETNEDGTYQYAEEATETIALITDDEYGSGVYQMRLKVSSGQPWFISEKPVWLNVYPTSGNSGDTPVFATADDDLRPILDEMGEIVFTENVESRDAVELGSVKVSIPGCGGTVELGQNFPADALISSDGWLYVSSNDGYWTSSAYCSVTAAYGSMIFFVSKDDWIDFEKELKFEETDYEGNDLTKYGLQRVGEMITCEPNLDEGRTAYLIGIPATVAAAFDPADALAADGTLNEAFEEYVLSTITQKPFVTEAEAKEWLYWDDGTNNEFAELSPILAGHDTYRHLFVKDWAHVPVAYNLHYNSLEAVGSYAIVVPEQTTSVEFTDVRAQGIGEGDVIEWAIPALENGKLSIALAYDYDAGEWKVDLPDFADWADFPGYIVLKDASGAVITFIRLTIDEDGESDVDEGNPIAGAWGWKGDTRTSLGLIPLSEGQEGFDSDFASNPQFKLELHDIYLVEFDKVPGEPTWVCSPDDPDTPLKDVFKKQEGAGNFFELNPSEDAMNGKLWVYFEGCLLYITYDEGTAAEGLALTEIQAGMAGDKVPLTALDSDDPNFDSELYCPTQYYAVLEDAPAKATVYANKAVDDMEIGLWAVYVDEGEDISDKFLDEQFKMISGEIEFDWTSQQGTIYFPDTAWTEVEAPAGHYVIVFSLKAEGGEFYAYLTVEVDVK